MKISDFTMPEVRTFLAECNFTKDEKELFLLRAEDICIDECSELMNISTSTAKRIQRKIWSKIDRIKEP